MSVCQNSYCDFNKSARVYDEMNETSTKDKTVSEKLLQTTIAQR